ncbi:phosphotransferase family protein [Desertimonas flava]|uniref:phosphotransferase family protein n=1 Tax=Desertimonas flava TaxID=2064846 RepID=UPI000E35323C|nr:phosphotransferase family protein [Desertimonas flava]
MTEGIDPEGIDTEKVGAWLTANVAGAEPPFRYDRIGGGRSNMTFSVVGANGDRYVLRRPPLGHVLATAHDMTREHRVITALGPTAVPVPATLGLCTDESVNGSPFYVMEMVDGVVVDAPPKAEPLSMPVRAHMTESLVDVLVSLHDVDPDAVGLGDFGRREGYVERQIRRWSKQWAGSKTRDLPAVDELATALADNIPEQQGAAITHGDYRFGNTIIDPATGDIVAVLDWELCTIGDPLADLGYIGVHWSDEASDDGRHNDPTSAGGFGTFAALLERYASKSTRDLSAIDYYVAFQYWRLAIILEGVYARYLHGAMGDQLGSAEVHAIGDGIFDLIDGAQAALARYRP